MNGEIDKIKHLLEIYLSACEDCSVEQLVVYREHLIAAIDMFTIKHLENRNIQFFTK